MRTPVKRGFQSRARFQSSGYGDCSRARTSRARIPVKRGFQSRAKISVESEDFSQERGFQWRGERGFHEDFSRERGFQWRGERGFHEDFSRERDFLSSGHEDSNQARTSFKVKWGFQGRTGFPRSSWSSGTGAPQNDNLLHHTPGRWHLTNSTPELGEGV